MGKDYQHLTSLQPTQIRCSLPEDNTSAVTCFLLSFSLDSADVARKRTMDRKFSLCLSLGHGEAMAVKAAEHLIK